MDLRVALNPGRILFFALILAFLALTIHAGTASAQNREAGSPRMDRAKMENRIEMMRKWRMMEEMDLSQEKYDRMLPILSKYKKEREALKQERTTLVQDLKTVLDRKEDVNPLLKKLGETEQSMGSIGQKQMTELQQVLSPAELAKFIVVNDEFEKDIRRFVSRKHEQRMERMMEGMQNMMNKGMGMGPKGMQQGMNPMGRGPRSEESDSESGVPEEGE